MKTKIKTFKGKKLPKKISNHITERLRRGYAISVIQDEIIKEFKLFVPRTFIFC
jgi:hypothetical protein